MFVIRYCWQPTSLPIPEIKGGYSWCPSIKHRRQTSTSCTQTFQIWRRGRVKGSMLREATQTKITQAQHPWFRNPNPKLRKHGAPGRKLPLVLVCQLLSGIGTLDITFLEKIIFWQRVQEKKINGFMFKLVLSPKISCSRQANIPKSESFR